MARIATLQQAEKDFGSLRGIRALVRVDFNVPIENERVVDDFRIKQSLETIQWLRERGVHLRLISHTSNDTLAPVVAYLQHRGFHTVFINDIHDTVAIAEADAQNAIILFENLRKYEGEKENDEQFGQDLAKLGELYVNEAFSVSHRMHASVVQPPRHIRSYIGVTCAREVEALGALSNPVKPYVAIIGGAKFDTKLPLVQTLRGKADTIAVVGALAHDIYVAQGHKIGESPVSDGVSVNEIADDPKIWVPKHVQVADGSFMNPRFCPLSDIQSRERIVDASAGAIEELIGMCRVAKTIVWNGPFGFYEKGFTAATEYFAKELARLSKKGTHVVIGGGDTLAAVAALNLFDDFSFVSTGGGAMIDMLAHGTLPGIEVLRGR